MREGGVVGLTELESVTSCVSSRRSNQLSYKPVKTNPTTNERPPKNRAAHMGDGVRVAPGPPLQPTVLTSFRNIAAHVLKPLVRLHAART